MRSLKITLGLFGAAAGAVVGWVWLVAALQPVRINYAFVVDDSAPGVLDWVRDYLPLGAPVLGALVGWLVAVLLVRSGWRMHRQ